MKNYFFSIFALFLIFFTFQSCNEDIEMLGDFKETAVVYGLLDQSESVHMIKITRAFIGPGNAVEIAKIPDSSYFNQVDATITEYVNNVKTNEWQLKDTMVANKDENGIFYAPEQKLYYFISDSVGENYGNAVYLNENAKYVFHAIINNGEFEIKGETQLVSGITNNIAGSPQPFRFADNEQNYISSLINISSTGNAHQINTKLTLEFTEWVGATGTLKSVDWTIGETPVDPNSTKVFSASGQTFYNLIKNNCSDDPAIDKRTFTGIRTTITGATEDLVNYILVNAPTSSLAQSKPTYTNLESTNGNPVVGIFTAVQTTTIYKPFIDPLGNSNLRCINRNTTEKLCTGGVSPYYFCSDHPADIAANYTWTCN